MDKGVLMPPVVDADKVDVLEVGRLEREAAAVVRREEDDEGAEADNFVPNEDVFFASPPSLLKLAKLLLLVSLLLSRPECPLISSATSASADALLLSPVPLVYSCNPELFKLPAPPPPRLPVHRSLWILVSLAAPDIEDSMRTISGATIDIWLVRDASTNVTWRTRSEKFASAAVQRVVLSSGILEWQQRWIFSKVARWQRRS